MIISYRYQVE